MNLRSNKREERENVLKMSHDAIKRINGLSGKSKIGLQVIRGTLWRKELLSELKKVHTSRVLL